MNVYCQTKYLPKDKVFMLKCLCSRPWIKGLVRINAAIVLFTRSFLNPSAVMINGVFMVYKKWFILVVELLIWL